MAVAVAGAASLFPANAAEYALAPGQNVVGDLDRHVIAQNDVFADIARHFDVGFTALVTANPGVDPWVPKAGQRVTIPGLHMLPDAPRQGLVLNLAQYRIFYFPPGGGRVFTYPIGIGVIGWNTPFGTTRVVRKQANPAWYPPPSIRAQHASEGDNLPEVVPPGPDNPLGLFALYLGWKNYLIHGTDKPDGVGRNVSHGCIHLYPEDIEQLFKMVPVGTPVRTVDQPTTAGWIGVGLYVQVYPSQSQTEEIDTEHPVTQDPAHGVRDVVRAAAGPYVDAVDWSAVDRAAAERTGMPVRVAEKPLDAAASPISNEPPRSAPADLSPPAAVPADLSAPAAAQADLSPPDDNGALRPDRARADHPDYRATGDSFDADPTTNYYQIIRPDGRDAGSPPGTGAAR